MTYTRAPISLYVLVTLIRLADFIYAISNQRNMAILIFKLTNTVQPIYTLIRLAVIYQLPVLKIRWDRYSGYLESICYFFKSGSLCWAFIHGYSGDILIEWIVQGLSAAGCLLLIEVNNPTVTTDVIQGLPTIHPPPATEALPATEAPPPSEILPRFTRYRNCSKGHDWMVRHASTAKAGLVHVKSD